MVLRKTRSSGLGQQRISRRPEFSKISSGLGLLAAFSVTTPALGAAWIVQPFIDVGAISDNNVELTTGPQQSASGYVVAGRLDVRRETETSKTRFDGFASHTSYNESNLEDRAEQGFTLKTQNQTSERSTLGLDGEFRHDALFQSTVARQGTGDLRDTDIGLTTNTKVRRNYLAAQPYWNWLLTERSAVRVAYRLGDVSFSNESGTGLVDYKEHLVSTTYTRQLNPQLDLNLTGNYGRYEPDAGTDSKTVQLLVGLTRAFSETLRGSFAVGASRTTENTPGTDQSTGGGVASASLQQRSELSTLEGIISSDVAPTGGGRSVRSDQVRVNWKRRLTERVDFILDSVVFRNQVLEGSDPDLDRRYFEISPQISWHWLENWAVSGSYRYRKQKFDAQPDSADSNAVFLAVTYNL